MSDTHIIIVNYNAGSWLLRAVDSALQFSTGPVTVIDNNSTDDSLALTQSTLHNERLRWILNQENLGFAAANNQVLRALDQEFAVLMNPDCELAEHTLSKILAAFERYPKMGLASARILYPDGSLQASCRRRFPTPWSALVRLLHLNRVFPNNPKFANFDYGDNVDVDGEIEFVEAISGAFMVARKEALIDVGLLDEGYFMHCEDLDWCKRFALAGWRVGLVPRAVVTHAKGVSSKSHPIRVLWTLHKGMSRFFNKFYHDDYPWLVRVSVRLGIYLSFAARAARAMVLR